MTVQRRGLSTGLGAWDVLYGEFRVWRAATRMKYLKGEKWNRNHTSMSGRSVATGMSRSELLKRAGMEFEAPHGSLKGVRNRGRRRDMV